MCITEETYYTKSMKMNDKKHYEALNVCIGKQSVETFQFVTNNQMDDRYRHNEG